MSEVNENELHVLLVKDVCYIRPTLSKYDINVCLCERIYHLYHANHSIHLDKIYITEGKMYTQDITLKPTPLSPKRILFFFHFLFLWLW